VRVQSGQDSREIVPSRAQAQQQRLSLAMSRQSVPQRRQVDVGTVARLAHELEDDEHGACWRVDEPRHTARARHSKRVSHPANRAGSGTDKDTWTTDTDTMHS
jgi:hypothetical protein